MSIALTDHGVAPVKRPLDIESALRWAYRDELPKLAAVPTREMALRQGPAKAGNGWDPMSSFAQLLACIDANHYGVVPSLTPGQEPHPDAILIGDAVEDLDTLDLSIPPDWYPLGDLGDLGQLGRTSVARTIAAETERTALGTLSLRTRPAVLVRKYALLGIEPEWEADVPEVKVVTQNGKPKWFMKTQQCWKDPFGVIRCDEVEEDGFNATGQRPHVGAYRKHYLDPDPSLAIVSRAEHEVWHAALSWLTETLATRLSSIRLTGFLRPARPWETPAAALGVVHRDLTERPTCRAPTVTTRAAKNRRRSLDMRQSLGVT